MLKHIDARATPELLYALARMGHGDEIALVDSNFPAYSTASVRPVVELSGLTAPAAAELLLTLITLDVGSDPCSCMQAVGNPNQWEPVHHEVQRVIDGHEDSKCRLKGIERFSGSVSAALVRSYARISKPSSAPLRPVASMLCQSLKS